MAAAAEPTDTAKTAGFCHQNGYEPGAKCARKTAQDFEIPFDKCLVCGLQHNSPEFGPLCSVCHDFLYPVGIRFAGTLVDLEDKKRIRDHQPLQNDQERRRNEEITANGANDRSQDENNLALVEEMEAKLRLDGGLTDTEAVAMSKMPYLSLYDKVQRPYLVAQRIACQLNVINDDLVENMPPEILQMIFSHLDEISLCMASQVCRLWQRIIGRPNRWRDNVLNKWPLLQPRYPSGGWKNLYIKLLRSITCRRCFERGSRDVPIEVRPLVEIQNKPNDTQGRRNGVRICFALYNFEKSSKEDTVDDLCTWRSKRIRTELRNMLQDPVHSIRAVPLDNSYAYWHGSIEGPVGSPYEGGKFFILIETLAWYPLRAPAVRFLTRIFHPNISFHGDIGMDTLYEGWSLALTMPKVLICIQSLLTDPYCAVSMEPEVSRLYMEDREEFNRIAREWTDKYAKFHLY